MIEIKDMSLTIGKAQILRHIDCKLENGHIYGLVGVNGCGKTMLMKCICGFIKPTSGNIFIDGKELGKEFEFAPNAGFLIEMPGFIPGYTGYRNLQLIAALKGDVAKEGILRCMEIAGIDHAANKRVGKYSLGMKQRLGIAQAIMGDPELYILDEPMNALDKNGIARLRAYLLEEKGKGKIIILASHNHEDIEVLCDTVFEMEEGRIL